MAPTAWFLTHKTEHQLPISILPAQPAWMGTRREGRVDKVWRQVPPLRVGGGGKLRELGEGGEDSLVISSNRTTGSEKMGFKVSLPCCNSNTEQNTHHFCQG